jgi:hypothetical protein
MKTLAAKLSILALVAVGALSVGALSALACGAGGYSYAGLGATTPAFGIGATVTPLGGFDVVNGHVAGWVGVGGPGQGPSGTNEWLQIGFSGFPGITGSDIYYEVAEPNRFPTYHQVADALPVGTVAKVTVLEMHNRPDFWRVWLNHKAVSPPIRLPGSHLAWSPIATAESWDGGTGGTCNTFLYRFRHVSIARASGGGWHPMNDAYPITSATTRIQHSRGSAAFFAAEGRPAFQLLSATS